jgi:hypothetical protein
MITARQLIPDIVKVLKRTATGKGKKYPQYIAAHQIFRRFPQSLRRKLEIERSKPGKGNGKEFTAVSLVAIACKMIPNVIIRLLDTEGIIFETGTNRTASAGYKVCCIYRLKPGT